MFTSKSKKQAAKLKDEGNALFTQKLYAEAYAKYSEAIAKDSTNATYFANRAACSLNMRKSLDAGHDALQATLLDPSYAKAHARLATAEFMIGSFISSVKSWQSAIAALPSRNLTPAELKQKAEWTRDISVAADRMDEVILRGSPPVPHPTQAPWLRAMAMEDELKERGDEGLLGSVWVILPAFRLWSTGIRALKDFYETGSVEEVDPTILENLTDSLIWDSRIFYEDQDTFSEIYNPYMKALFMKFKFTSTGGTEHITSQILQRQEQDGWDATRTSLNLTIRTRILRAFVTGKSQRHYIGEEISLRCVLDVLEWGNTGPWKDVPLKTKGDIFARKFVRGIRSLHMISYRQASGEDPQNYPMENLYEEAKAALQECESAEEKSADLSSDRGFVNAFYNYPKGFALGTIGYYHSDVARKAALNSEPTKYHSNQAAQAFRDAAECFPQDDELHVYWLSNAIHSMWHCPAQDLVPIMEKLRLAELEKKKIWEHSLTMNAIPDYATQLETIISTEKKILEGILLGKFKLEDPLIPEDSLPQ
ncbi:hypothetical protein QCA50_001415 [Cerrena zonata]|uniref:TPR-like protein n=1 Tax=Cerrena zonata TaxID=2478898 RepID=A0AAW0GT74_9APHY